MQSVSRCLITQSQTSALSNTPDTTVSKRPLGPQAEAMSDLSVPFVDEVATKGMSEGKAEVRRRD